MVDHTSQPTVLVAGCGKLGGRIAQANTHRARVYGLRRNPDKVPEDVTPIAADLTRPETLANVLPDTIDVLVYCLTPASYDDTGYQNAYVTGLKNLLDALGGRRLKRLIFVSSTSVYAQDDDSWVDETSPTEPARYSGNAILEGERLALGSGHPATVVRFSGIYGPSRQRFLEEVLEGRMNPQRPAPFSNRIHEDDAEGVVSHMISESLAGHALESVYVATDSLPVRLDDVVAWVQAQIPCKPPVEGARKGGRAGSKRCSNRRLLDSGYKLKYPDYKAGYREMIQKLER
jgi:nucleoside-diphosphate-sugar epimerase